jgi:hypothetical protein
LKKMSFCVLMIEERETGLFLVYNNVTSSYEDFPVHECSHHARKQNLH